MSFLYAARGSTMTIQRNGINYNVNEFKELSQVLEDILFVDNCKTQSCFVMSCMFGSSKIIGFWFTTTFSP